MISEVRRGLALAGRKERRRLGVVAAYGVLIAALDTVALLLLFVLITVLLDQPVGGFAKVFVGGGHLNDEDRYHTALILLGFTAMLFVVRSLLSVFGLWLTIGASNAAQADLVSRLLVGHARAPHLVRLGRNSSETLRTVVNSVAQVFSGIVSSAVSLAADGAVVVAVIVGLTLASPVVALTVAAYFLVVAVVWVRVVRGGLVWRGRVGQQLEEERFRFVLQGIAAAKELQLRGRSVFYAEEASIRTRGILAASRGLGVVNGSLRYLLETALVMGAVWLWLCGRSRRQRCGPSCPGRLVARWGPRAAPGPKPHASLDNRDPVQRAGAGFGRAGRSKIYCVANRGVLRRVDCRCSLAGSRASLRMRGGSHSDYPTRDRARLRDVSVNFIVRPGKSVRHRRADRIREEYAPRRHSWFARARRRILDGRWYAAYAVSGELATFDRVCPTGRLPRRRHGARERRSWLAGFGNR